MLDILRTMELDWQLLEKWFKVDNNAVPPVRVLQPIRYVLTDYQYDNYFLLRFFS